MAVLSVKADWQEYGGDFDTEQASAHCKYTVQFDTADPPEQRQYLALNANDGTTRVPNFWERHPHAPYLFVRGKIPKAIGPFYYEVMVSYSTLPMKGRESDYDPTKNPLEQPWDISWSFVARNEKIDTDIYGNPLTNSAKAGFDPPITKDFYDLVLQVRRNQATYDPLFAGNYIDSVNEDYWYCLGLSFAPLTAKCVNFGGTWARSADLFYWIVNYEFHFRLGPWANELNDNVRWRLRLIDAGYRALEYISGQPVNPPRYSEIKIGTKQERLTEPWPLYNGAALSEDNVKAGEVYFKTFEINAKRVFSVLGF
jgi:hypothetical protein